MPQVVDILASAKNFSYISVASTSKFLMCMVTDPSLSNFFFKTESFVTLDITKAFFM